MSGIQIRNIALDRGYDTGLYIADWNCWGLPDISHQLNFPTPHRWRASFMTRHEIPLTVPDFLIRCLKDELAYRENRAICECYLLIIDELGNLHASKIEENLFFQLISSLYKTPVVITCNRDFDGWPTSSRFLTPFTFLCEKSFYLHHHIFNFSTS